MLEDSFAMAGSLSNTDRSRDDGVVKLCWKVGGNLFNHLAREISATIVHGHDNALKGELRVGSGLSDLFDHLDNFGKPFQAEPLTLKRNKDFICRR